MLPVYNRHDPTLPWKPEQVYLPLWLQGSDLFALVDPIDHEWAQAHTWSITWDRHGRKPYAVCYVQVGGRTRKFYFHKEITYIAYGNPPTHEHTIGDHLDGDSLDCRRDNLGWATPSQNRITANRQRMIDGRVPAELALRLGSY